MMKPMMITMIMPAIAGTKYMSATDVGVAVGAEVGELGAPTAVAVSAHEP